MSRRFSFTLGAIGLIVLAVAVASLSSRSLRGSLTDDKVLTLLDLDHNGALNTSEMRKGIRAFFIARTSQDLAFDLNADSTVNRPDLLSLIASLHAFLIASCGNGSLEAAEQCDDGGTANGDGCSSMCRIESGFNCSGTPSVCVADSVCGNRIIGVNEECDDGNGQSGDGCDHFCTVESGFTCAGVPSVCTASVCGDGLIEAGEQCDDHNVANGDGCSAACTVESGFSCNGIPSACAPDPVCGNGLINGSESCDDGNTASGDGCSAVCAVESGYACGGQPSQCSHIAVCGDGVLEGNESCDDHNAASGDGCSATCGTESGYVCVGQPSQCSLIPVCGDGLLEGNESCDDHNAANGDGCSATCGVESGFTCSGSPSVCNPTVAVCGNGVIEDSEQCDDGNTQNGDGCTASCTNESGFACVGRPSACIAAPDPGATVATMTDTFPNPVFGSTLRIDSACKNVASPCDWNTPGTWTTGQVPTAGDKVIVDGFVRINSQSAVADGVGVYPGGVLTFNPNANTRLQLANLIVFNGGTLLVGTSAQPIDQSVTAEIRFNDTAINPTVDPNQFLTTFTALGGVVRVYGHALAAPYIQIANEPQVGNTTIPLLGSAITAGWSVGDSVMIPRSAQCRKADGDTCPDQSEYLTIAGIASDGLSITLSNPLAFSHPGARNPATNALDFTPHVLNLTRNVLIDSPLANATRAHVLFTGRADVDVRFAALRNLGRTTIADLTNAAGTNLKGRYPLHNHHLLGPVQAQLNGRQYTYIGNMIDFGSQNTGANGRKWGIAIHDSHFGLVKDNIVVRASGGGIVDEIGSEYHNVFDGNFVADVVGGNGARTNDQAFDGSKQFRAGVGFYMSVFDLYTHNHAAAVVVANCIYCYGYKLDLTGSPTFKYPSQQGNDPMVAGQGVTVSGNAVPFNGFNDNEIYASPGGLTYWWVGLAYRTPKAVAPSVISALKAWHFHEWGVFAYESKDLTLDHFVMRNDPAALANIYAANLGISYGDYAQMNTTVANADIRGTATGIYGPTCVGSVGTPSSYTIRDSVLQSITPVKMYGITSVNGSANLDGRNAFLQNNQLLQLPTVNPARFTSISVVSTVPPSLGTPNLTVSRTVTVTSYNNASGDDFNVFATDQTNPAPTCSLARQFITGYVCPLQ